MTLAEEQQPLVHRDAREHDLAIVIVNLDAVDMLRDCLASLRRHAGAVRTQLIVVDNGSRDASVSMVQAHFPEVLVLPQGKNLGYVPANNIGLREVTAPYTMFLNNDTLVEPHALELIVEFLDANPKVGAVSGKILNPDGSDQGTARRFPTVANALFGRRSWLTRHFPNNRWSRSYMVGRHRSDDEPFEVEILSSACMVVRTDLAKALGGMDEDFKLYWVDAELCSRVRARGLEVWCVPRSRIIHFEGQGGSTRTFRQRMRSTIAFHMDAYHAYTKVYGFAPWRPGAVMVGALLALRGLMLIGLQLLRPSRATSSGGKN